MSTSFVWFTFSGVNQPGEVISACGGILFWSIRSSARPRSGRP